jgi:hypothetical protein
VTARHARERHQAMCARISDTKGRRTSAVIGRVTIKPGHEDETLAMIDQHGVGMLQDGGLQRRLIGRHAPGGRPRPTLPFGSSRARRRHEPPRRPSTRSRHARRAGVLCERGRVRGRQSSLSRAIEPLAGRVSAGCAVGARRALPPRLWTLTGCEGVAGQSGRHRGTDFLRRACP